MSIASISIVNNTILLIKDGNGQYVEWDPISIGYMTSLMSYLTVLVFIMSVFQVRKKIDKWSEKDGDTSLSIEEYAVYIQGLPEEATREEIKEHFEQLFSFDEKDWTFKGYCCGCLGKKKPRVDTEDMMDRGVIMYAYDENNEVEKGVEKRIVHTNMIEDFERVQNTDHCPESPEDVIGSAIAEVCVARKRGKVITSMLHLKAKTLKLLRAKALIKKRMHELKSIDRSKPGKVKVAEKRKEAAEKNFERISGQVEKSLNKLDKHCKLSEQKACVGAYVVFNNELSAKRCVDDYRKASWCNGILYPKTLMFKDKKISVSVAPPPSDILWENLEHKPRHLCIRRTLSMIGVMLVIGITYVIVNQSSSLRLRHAANTKLPSFSDCKMAGDFFLNNTYDVCQVNNTDLFCTQCHQNNGLSGMLEFGLNDEKCSGSGGFARSYAMSQTYSIIGSVIVVVANQSLRTIMKFLSDFEQFSSVTSTSKALASKFFIAQFINTAIVLLVVNAAIANEDVFAWIFAPFKLIGMFQGEFDDFSNEWYASVGTPLLITLGLNAVTPHIAPLAQYFIVAPLMRCLFSSSKATQRDLNLLQAGPQFEVTTRSAQLLNHVVTTMVFAPGLPLLWPIAFFACFTFYYVDLFLLLKFYRRPPSYNEKIGKFTISVFEISIFVNILFCVWTYGNQAVLASQSVVEGGSLAYAQFRKYARGDELDNNRTILFVNSTNSTGNFGDRYMNEISVYGKQKHIQGTIFATMIERLSRAHTFFLFMLFTILIFYKLINYIVYPEMLELPNWLKMLA